MAEETRTTSRLEVRLHADIDALLKHAAEIEGAHARKEFVVSAAIEAAVRAIEGADMIPLSIDKQRQIAEALVPRAGARAGIEERFSLLQR
jgi:uncharacterized protein (DUF1778 family)